MIVSIQKAQLPECLDILRQSYETTAITFGMTEANCPYRGRTRLPLAELEREYDQGACMAGYIHHGQLVGFLSMRTEGAVLEIQDIAVPPRHQGQGYGSALFQFARETAEKSGCVKIRLGMVYDNLPLRGWYESLGFQVAALKKFEKVSYTVGIMELPLRRKEYLGEKHEL